MKPPLFALVVLAALAGCRTPTDPVVPVIGQSLSHSFANLSSGSSAWVEGSEEDVANIRNLKVSLTLPSAPTTVYFLYTNVANNTSVQNLGGVSADRGVTSRGLVGPASDRPFPRLEKTFPRTSVLPKPGAARAIELPPAPSDPELKATGDFVDSLDSPATAANHHPMTLRVKQIDTAADRTLYVWVVDDCYEGSDAAKGTRFKVTTAMAQALANKFLKPGEDKDIYGLVTRMLGAEWTSDGVVTAKDGRSYGAAYIHGGKQIHIVLADLNPEVVDPTKKDPRRFGGGLQGYFHGWNNQRDVDSNEKILFAIDANSLANPDKDGMSSTADPAGWPWSLEGSYYPNDIVATLAHEFQHMVHFYQKALRNGTSEAADWINEMASMAVEDLVADQVGFRGPRGLPGGDYTTGTGTKLIDDGRLPLFNGTHEQVPLQDWGRGDNSLPHYANAYAFGAWLTRNYGGPVFWRELVQGPGTSVQAVIDTLNAHRRDGEPVQTYASMVRNWGLAVFYGRQTPSAEILTPLAYSAAPGSSSPGAFDFSLDATDYKTGSIDLYRYTMVDAENNYIVDGNRDRLAGPSTWNGAPTVTDALAAGATWISRVGSGTGPWSRTLNLPPSIVVTVLVARN